MSISRDGEDNISGFPNTCSEGDYVFSYITYGGGVVGDLETPYTLFGDDETCTMFYGIVSYIIYYPDIYGGGTVRCLEKPYTVFGCGGDGNFLVVSY